MISEKEILAESLQGSAMISESVLNNAASLDRQKPR